MDSFLVLKPFTVSNRRTVNKSQLLFDKRSLIKSDAISSPQERSNAVRWERDQTYLLTTRMPPLFQMYTFKIRFIRSASLTIIIKLLKHNNGQI